VAEIVEGSVMLATQALLMSGVPLNRVMRRLRESRARSYRALDAYYRVAGGVVDDDDAEEENQIRLHSVLLDEMDVAVGQTLGQLNLATLEVEVNAVRRHGVLGTHPTDDMLLFPGDVLVLLGQSVALAAAEQYLRSGE
jgi:CPA2 family monovalent cation:H+ antiporter-2